MKKIFLITFSLTLLLTWSCSKDTTSATCDTASMSYANNIAPIMSSSCATSGCHTTSSKAGGYDLSNWAGVKASVTAGRLYGSIAQSSGFKSMPQGGSKLSDCNIAKIKSWIDAGAPNN